MSVVVPAIEGWFTSDGAPALLGGRCCTCATFLFPVQAGWCPNPSCDGRDIEQVALSSQGVLWSYATNHHPPPPPAVVAAPYTVVAVTLEREALTVLGLLSDEDDPAALRVGMPMTLVIEPLTTDEDGTVRTVWKWRAGGAS